MSPWLIGLILRPLAALLLFGCIALSIRWLIWHKMPESKLKNVILKHRGGKIDSLSR